MKPPVERKIVGPDELLATARALRAAGKTIVQCHGCFDIVHPGHVRYLQFARQLGDVLVVSLTGDAAVEKGPGRPYIPQELRAENLAALEFVDWVVIDPHPTARELLAALRPDVYVKGREYASVTDPRFVREREEVESYGGRVVFHSGDVIFSSTRLLESIGRDEQLDEHRLRAFCQRGGIDNRSVQAALDAFAGVRAIVIGDLVRERYVFCDASTVAEDAPVPALQRLGATEYWGGAAAVALQLLALGAEPLLVAAVGHDEVSQELAKGLKAAGVTAHLLRDRPAAVDRCTFIADDSKLFKLEDGTSAPLDSAAERRATNFVCDQLDDARLVVWCDHGYGMVTPSLVRSVACDARRRGVCLVGYAPGQRGQLGALVETDLLTATERQLREATHDMGSGLPAVVGHLLSRTRGRAMIVSLRKRGLMAFERLDGVTPSAADRARLKSEFVPAFAQHYVDFLGADEAVLATAALAVSTRAALPLAAYLAAVAECLTSARPGGEPVRTHELHSYCARRSELRPDSRFFPDAATIADIARLAPPLPTPGAGERDATSGPAKPVSTSTAVVERP